MSEVVTVDPATGRELRRYDVMTAAHIEAVVEQVAVAQKAWADTPINARAAVMLRAAALLRERSAELGALATAGLSVLLPPLGLVALAAIVYLGLARHSRAARKYEGLRTLR